jgi:hypothetical protein
VQVTVFNYESYSVGFVKCDDVACASSSKTQTIVNGTSPGGFMKIPAIVGRDGLVAAAFFDIVFNSNPNLTRSTLKFAHCEGICTKKERINKTERRRKKKIKKGKGKKRKKYNK